MRSNLASIPRWPRCLDLSVICFGMAIMFFTMVQPVQAEPVRLQLKGKVGAESVREYVFTGTYAERHPDGSEYRTAQTTTLHVSSVTETVRRSGRQSARHRLDWLVSKTSTGGGSVSVFDSRRREHLEGARRDPNFGYILAALESDWTVTIDRSGEVLDLEYRTPTASGGETMAPIVERFLETIFDLGRIILPDRPVDRGDTWECAEVVVPMPGGRMKGKAECELQAVRNEGGERTAIVAVRRRASFRPNPGSGLTVELQRYEEQCSFSFAVDRGAFKLVRLQGRIEASVRSERGTVITNTTNELVVKERQ